MSMEPDRAILLKGSFAELKELKTALDGSGIETTILRPNECSLNS